LLAVAGAFLLWSLLMAVVVVPDDWDAWAMWGAKAKVLALGHGPLAEVTRFGSPEYPLLWPCLWAFTGWLGGGWEECWAKGWGTVLLGLTAWQILAHLRRRSSSSRLTVAEVLPPVVFVTMPFVSLSASWAYAEPAYWLTLACAWSALIALRDRPCGWTATIAGLLLAAAMYAKNEGGVFAAIASAWLLPQRELRPVHKLTVYATAAFAFLPWLAWTRLLHGLDTTSTGGFVTLADAAHRLGTSGSATVAHMFRIALDPRLWGLGLAGVVGVALYALFSGGAAMRRVIAVVAALLIVYTAVLFLGRNDPLWQVGVAWSRLVTHLALLTIMVAGDRLPAAMRNEPFGPWGKVSRQHA
jgi:hypothetical protein